MLSVPTSVERKNMKEFNDFPEVVTINSCAKFYGFSRGTAYRLMEVGDISSCLIAGRRLITSQSVHDFVLRQITAQYLSNQNTDWIKTFMDAYRGLPVLLSISRISANFALSRRSAYRLSESGRITTIKAGRARFVVTESIQHHIKCAVRSQHEADGFICGMLHK